MLLPQLRTLHLTEPLPPDETHQSRKYRQRMYQYATMGLGLRHDVQNKNAIEYDMLLFKEVVLELRHTPPVGLTLDLMALWRHGSQFTPRSSQPHERPFHRLRLKLQNEVLYRLLRNHRFKELRHILSTLSTTLPQANSPSGHTLSNQKQTLHNKKQLSLLDKAIIFLTAQLYRSVTTHLVQAFRPHPMYPQTAPQQRDGPSPIQSTTPLEKDLQPIWLKDPVVCIQRLEEDIEQPGWITEHIETLVEQWLQLDPDDWLPQSSIPIVRFMKDLESPLQRIQWEQLHQTLAQIPPAANLHKLVRLREIGYREQRIPTSSTKPEGGYSGLARRGDIASLLPSELLFWDDSQPMNPFFVRWVEHETLYYEREQNYSNTRHRQIQFILDLQPGEIRYKAPHLPAPGLTLVLALIARICLDLRQVCPEEVLHLHVVLGPRSLWKEDTNLIALFFEHLPQIGASTNFLLVENPITYIESQPPNDNQLALYVASPSRWTSQPTVAPFHMLILPEYDKRQTHASVQLALEDIDPNLDELARLRDHMLESILRTPPLTHMEKYPQQKKENGTLLKESIPNLQSDTIMGDE